MSCRLYTSGARVETFCAPIDTLNDRANRAGRKSWSEGVVAPFGFQPRIYRREDEKTGRFQIEAAGSQCGAFQETADAASGVGWIRILPSSLLLPPGRRRRRGPPWRPSRGRGPPGGRNENSWAFVRPETCGINLMVRFSMWFCETVRLFLIAGGFDEYF